MRPNFTPDGGGTNASSATANGHHPSVTEAGDGASPSILLVADGRLTTLIDLRDAGYRAEAVRYRDFSEETIRSQQPALIILDLSLPIKIAVEICTQIKSQG